MNYPLIKSLGLEPHEDGYCAECIYADDLEKLLSEATVVYSEHGKLPWFTVEHSLCTHQAYIFGQRPIKECEHKAVPYLGTEHNTDVVGAYCKLCSKKLKPNGWSVVDD